MAVERVPHTKNRHRVRTLAVQRYNMIRSHENVARAAHSAGSIEPRVVPQTRCSGLDLLPGARVSLMTWPRGTAERGLA